MIIWTWALSQKTSIHGYHWNRLVSCSTVPLHATKTGNKSRSSVTLGQRENDFIYVIALTTNGINKYQWDHKINFSTFSIII